ncbi:MAG TPA: translocation/assembly module TamB domain-containing protein [Marinospirillum sp.]|uniref:translocation/assembly module TamB domain-containing protein n=1 Tax=Marinospirillum sp. TaxID=2183934 RepID=UPI002B49515C|nr:translocation/assembly module TamB domain-containing protein [Marinospirillum sp.]HKM14945.1 translocation/assembly module TamB domain-containing protein [Marinospirillum sp.]
MILIIGWLFFTSLGGQWLLQQVPGLTLSGFQGQLLGKWQAKNVQWQSPNLSLKIQGLVFDWQPRCLLERKVCFNDLQLTAVHIKTATPPKAAPLPIDWASLHLPAIELPHLDLLELAFLQGIEVNNLVIGDLKLNDQQQLSHLQLAVTWQATRIDLKNLQVQSPFLLGGISTKAHLSGWLMTEKNWPLNLKLTSELSEAPIKVNLSGDFSKLNLQARLIATTASASFAEKHSDIHLKGWVNLLQPAAPIQLSLNWQNLDLHKIHPKFASLPDAIQLQQGALNLQGDLAKGWRLKLDTKQQLNNQPLILNLAANLSWEKLQIENLSIYLDKANWLALDLDLNLERWQANLDVKITDLDVLSSRLISLIHTFSPKLITEPQLAALLVEPLLAGDLQLDSHFEMPAIVSSEALQKALTQSHFQLNLASQFLRYTNLQLEKTDLALTYNGQENHQDPSLSLAFTSQQLQQGQAIDLDEGAERLLLKNLRLHLVGLLSKHKLISGLILDDQPLELSFDGGVQLKNLDDVQWRYQLATLSTQLLTPWLPEDLRWIDEIGGDIDGQWRNQQLQASLVLNGGPGELAVKLEDTLNETFTWTALNYHLLNLGLSLKDQKLTMYFTLNGEALGYLNTAVTLDLQPDSVQQQRALKGHYQLNHLQLKLFAPFIDIDKLDGQLVGQGKIRGHLLAPEVWGHLQLQKVVATDTYWPVSLQQLDGELLLQGKHLELNADFLTGEGGVGKLSGEMHWLPELAARIQLQGNAFNVRIEPYASLQVTPDLIFTYQQKKGLLAGQIKIPSGLISVQQLPKQAIKASSDAQVIGRKVVTGNNTALNLDLELLLGNVSLPNEAPLKLEVMGLEAEIQGRLRVANNMQTRGELLLVKGTFQSWGQDLKLRKARLNFAGPVSLPFLDIEAVREVQDITVGIHMTGRADRPETEIFSEPPMANEQALSWLILGRPLQTEQDENSLNAAAISFGLKQASGITGRLGESVGLKDFQLLAEGSGSDTSVVASGYISEKVSVSYGVGVYDEISRFVVRYELSRQVYIEAASSLASSLDIFWRLVF